MLLDADRRAFAWEWLRRTSEYRDAWALYRRDATLKEGGARRFGLERFENPDVGAPAARPVWTADADPGVVKVRPVDLFAHAHDRLDLYRLHELVTVTIDADGDEHLLLSDGRNFVRLDVVEGSVIGSPCSLLYILEGAASARERMATVHRLIDLIARDEFPAPHFRRSHRQQRWIAELRVADALSACATQREIARILFGDHIPDARWRVDAAPYRRRVQRLVAGARARQRLPIDRRWFRSVGT